MSRIRLPSIGKMDVELMVRAHAALVAAHQASQQINSAARPLIIAAIDQADELIVRLYNRCERCFAAPAAEAEAPPSSNDQSVLTARVESNGNLDLNSTDKERV